jgi:hypothetical protein
VCCDLLTEVGLEFLVEGKELLDACYDRDSQGCSYGEGGDFATTRANRVQESAKIMF